MMMLTGTCAVFAVVFIVSAIIEAGLKMCGYLP